MNRGMLTVGDLLVLTLEELGGIANLNAIYSKSHQLWRKYGFDIPENFESEIRATLQYHSLESKKQPKGEILFRMAKERGRGWWALVKKKPLTSLIFPDRECGTILN